VSRLSRERKPPAACPPVPAALAAAEVTSLGRLWRRVYGPLRPFLAAEILAQVSGLCG
jgi:hypothetical protein